ncbi:MAG TPA: hypothetical protein PK590_01035 [Candidatus Omnitrophota bacterium]|nr:hypothetical protein [Candidatus Omnitrophota bacterium]
MFIFHPSETYRPVLPGILPKNKPCLMCDVASWSGTWVFSMLNPMRDSRFMDLSDIIMIGARSDCCVTFCCIPLCLVEWLDSL